MRFVFPVDISRHSRQEHAGMISARGNNDVAALSFFHIR
jgi:hypothetical protein